MVRRLSWFTLVLFGGVGLPAIATGQQNDAPAGLTLGAAITEALQHSPDLHPRDDAFRSALVGNRLATSEFGLKIAPNISAGSDPAFGPTRNAGVAVTKRLTTGGQVFANLSSYELGTSALHLRDTGYTVGVSQPLLRGFQRTALAGVNNAARATQSAARERETARAALAVRVTTQFVEVVKQQRLTAAAEKAAARAEKFRMASEARTRVGLATELDILRARILASQSAAALAAARGAHAAALDQLALVIGRTPGDPLAVVADASILPDGLEDLPASVEELVMMATATRIEIAEAHDRVADATRAAKVAQWNRLPPVALDVSYTQRGLGGSNAALNDLLSGWRFGLSTSYGLDRAAATAASETADIAELAAARSVRDAEQRIAAEVRQLHRSWQTAVTTLAIREEAMALAERELELAALRYERGLASSLDVVSAEANLLQADNARIATELDAKVFALDLRRAVGRLDIGSLTK